MIRRFHISMACLVLAACGTDGPNFGPEIEPTPAQTTAINTMQQSLNTFAKTDLTGTESEAAAFYFAFAGQSLLAGSGAAAISAPNGAAPPALALDDCAVVTDHSITWHHCTDHTGYTIDGTISWSPGHVDVDIDWVGTSSGYTFNWSLNGSMSVSASAIQGDMTFAVSYS